MHAVCEASRCLDITCPVGMAVVSTRDSEECCPLQTCGKRAKPIITLYTYVTALIAYLCLCVSSKEHTVKWISTECMLLSLLECACEKLLRPKCSLVSLPKFILIQIYYCLHLLFCYLCVWSGSCLICLFNGESNGLFFYMGYILPLKGTSEALIPMP